MILPPIILDVFPNICYIFVEFILDLLTTQDPDVITCSVQDFPVRGLNFDLGASKVERVYKNTVGN